MKLIVCIFICLCAFVQIHADQNLTIHPYDDPRINRLGAGFCILDNKLRESVFTLESNIRANPDLPIKTMTLPNGVVMINEPENDFKYYAEVISQNTNIKDSRDIKVSGSAHVWLIKESFSYESKIVKQFISNRNTKVTRVFSNVKLATFILETSQMKLTNGIHDRLVQIAHFLDKNTIITNGYAIAMADEILRDYGTHVIDEITVGGVISKIDNIDTAGTANSDERSMSASASASFSSYVSVKGSISTDHTADAKYNKATINTNVHILGGKPWKESSTFNTWVDELSINPALVGANAIYIVDIVRQQYLPDLIFDQIIRVKGLLNDRVNVYMRNNEYMGCGDVSADNFVSYANVFSKNLCNYQKEFHFGGTYTVSSDPSFSVPNILTEKFKCPEGFEPRHLLDQKITKTVSAGHICHYFWFLRKCHEEYKQVDIDTTTFACISHKNHTNGVFFGGIYTETINNDITEAKECPKKYIPFPIYHDDKKQHTTYICEAPYDSGAVVSVPFGGIFSSQYPNYMVGNKPVCQGNFERHPVGASPIAELTYCIGLGSLNLQTKDIIPPGYGSSVVEQYDYYKIWDIENNHTISVKVNPFNKSSYLEQVIDLATENIPIDHAQNNVLFKSKDVDDKTCYLKKWMVKSGLYDYLEDQTEATIVMPTAEPMKVVIPPTAEPMKVIIPPTAEPMKVIIPPTAEPMKVIIPPTAEPMKVVILKENKTEAVVVNIIDPDTSNTLQNGSDQPSNSSVGIVIGTIIGTLVVVLIVGLFVHKKYNVKIDSNGESIPLNDA
jgi:hypothetical protein